MPIVTNFNELMRLHKEATAARPGSKAYFDFAATMFDSFPALYEKAKKMNELFALQYGELRLDKPAQVGSIVFEAGNNWSLVINAAQCIYEQSGAEDDDMSTDADAWERNDQGTYMLLCLVGGHSVTPEAISAWSDEECQQAEAWAGACHLHASDHDDVVVPPMPEHVRKYPQNDDQACRIKW
jgi:hypothetical protein